MKSKFPKFLVVFFLMAFQLLLAQTKVSGIILDKSNQPIPFANVVFKKSNVGVVANEDGRFYIESPQKHSVLVVSSAGFSEREIYLDDTVVYNFKVKLNEAESLNEVVVFTGKTSKKNNPALEILRKIWERKRKNGLYQFDQYQMEKYEKVEFDMNTIDSAFMKNKVFKGMEFVFKHVDTSKVTGKTYLPIFINESLADVYGDNRQIKHLALKETNKFYRF
jgi:hypothetical protein